MPKKVDKVVALPPATLAEITALARQQRALEVEIGAAEQRLSDLKKAHFRISQEDLPLAMDEAGGLKLFKLDDGTTVEVKRDHVVGIPAARREEAFKWLEDRGYGGIILTEVITEFGKGQMNEARKLLVDLSKKKLSVKLERGVHWQTLKAFVNDQIRTASATERPDPNKLPPFDLFGVQPVNKAVVKLPKSK